MTPQDFGEFRAALAPASGFQSVQFRELEFLSGLKDPGFVRRFRQLTGAERDRLARRLAEPSLWDAFLAVLRARGLPVGDDNEILASLVTVARDRAKHDEQWQLAEDLLTHDEIAGLWRARHVQMVERQIGTQIRNRRLDRRSLPSPAGAAAVLPVALGPARLALAAATARPAREKDSPR